MFKILEGKPSEGMIYFPVVNPILEEDPKFSMSDLWYMEENREKALSEEVGK